jgi:polyhydroxyalkanoate synthesis repressor PhaR
MAGTKGLITIKKYANRRLYNTDSSSYVTLDFLSQLVRDGIDFEVLDAKTGDDITRQVLTQIIFEAENSGSSLLSVSFLRDVIGFYGKSVQGFFPNYLEMSVKNFEQTQEQWRNAFTASNTTKPMELFSSAMKANMEIFGKAAQAVTGMAAANPFSPAPIAEMANKSTDDALKLMQQQMELMQAQLDKLAK